jgi:phosphoinositide-3-kinase, regulatory subunit 4
LRAAFQIGPRAVSEGNVPAHSPIPIFTHVRSEDGPALIVLALVTSNIRNCVQPTSKVRALDVLLALAVHLTDEAKLDRMVPYIVDLLHDDAAVVRAAAMRTLMQTVCRLFT